MSVTIRGTKTKGSARTFATVTQLQHDWLFQSWVLQAPRRWTNMNRDLADASRRAKLSFVVTPNDLRRTFASWLIEAGVTREEVAKMLGHSGTAMVFRVYGRADPEKEGESIRRRLAATPDPDPETCNVCHHRYGNPRHTLPGLVRCPACGRFAVPADLTPHAAGPACTDPSHLPACAPLPAAASVRIFGVSDGDRTRDNRSHNPVARRKRPVKP
jgi:hypothetical protein